MSLNEFIVEDVALEWFWEPVCSYYQGFGLAPTRAIRANMFECALHPMKTNSEYYFIAKSRIAPVITFDGQSKAAYIYFQKPGTKVAKTVNRLEKSTIINVDLDKKGDVIGIEAIGFKDLQISKLLKKAHVNADAVNFSEATLQTA